MTSSYAPLRNIGTKSWAFVLGTAVVALGLFLLAARVQGWFDPVIELEVDLPFEGSFGLDEGADVEMLGTVVGVVDRIDVDAASGRMVAHLTIEEGYGTLLGSESKAVLRKRFSSFGDTFVVISRGAGQPRPTRLTSTFDPGAIAILEDMLDEVRTVALPAFEDLHSGLQEYRDLARDLRSEHGPIADLVAVVDRLVTTIESGEGLVGRLLTDPDWANEFDASITKLAATIDSLERPIREADRVAFTVAEAAASVHEATGQLPEILADIPAMLADTKVVLRELRVVLEDVRDTSVHLPAIADTVRREMTTFPGSVLEARTAIREIERLVRALERHWLLRDYVEPEAPVGRLSPDEVSGAPEER